MNACGTFQDKISYRLPQRYIPHNDSSHHKMTISY